MTHTAPLLDEFLGAAAQLAPKYYYSEAPINDQ
jgi:hypothetical protein